MGTPYSFGGDCTNPHGGDPAHQCDCSSLIQQAYKAAGISLPRTSDRDAVALLVVRALLAVVGLNHSDTDEIVTLAVICGLVAAVARLVIRRQR